MSYSVKGIVNAFKKAPALTTGVREIGQLVYINGLGEATLTTGTGATAFPLTERFDVTGGETVCAGQVSGIAQVWVETVTSIVAGSPLKQGTTGVGVALATTGDLIIGYALETPAAAGTTIPVLLGKSKA